MATCFTKGWYVWYGLQGGVGRGGQVGKGEGDDGIITDDAKEIGSFCTSARHETPPFDRRAFTVPSIHSGDPSTMTKFLRLLPCVGLIGVASGFAPASRWPAMQATSLFSTAASEDVDSATSSPLDGVSDFEEWFASNSGTGARVNNIRHALFDSMGRGLQFTSTKSSDLNKVAVVPRKMVLHVPFSDEEESDSGLSWDTSLSLKLWQECQKGKRSAYYG